MKYKEFHKLIEEQNPEQKQLLHKKLKQDLNITDASMPTEAEQIHKKPTFSYKRFYRIFAGVSAAVAAVCLAIVLPIVLNRGTTVPAERYCHAADCVETVADYTVKDYSVQKNLSLLYLDWYDIADEVQTKVFVNTNDSSDIVYFEETLVNGVTGDIAILYITELHTKVDIFEDVQSSCENFEYISSVKVSWGYEDIKGTAYFEYSDRSYVIELLNPLSEDAVLDLVESMLSKK